MNKIKWDEKFFNQSGNYVWVFNNGLLECTNEKLFKPVLLKIYYLSRTKSINNLIINKNKKGKK